MELKGKVLHALRWTASLRLLSQFMTWAMTLYVVRLISVDDYGLYSLAMIFGGLLMWVNELGIGAALVQKKNITPHDFRLGFGVVIVTNLLFSLTLVLLSPLIAHYFNEPKLTPILQTISIGFMTNAFIVIPESYLTRKLDFKRKSIVELVSNFSGGLITLVFAYLGHGIWAMVYGFVSIWAIRAIGLNFISPIHVWPRFSFREGKHILRFGGLVTLDHLAWYLYARADAFIIGKLLGTNVLGIYSVALHIASMPMQKINGLLNEIAFPAFSSIQSDRDKIQWYLLKAIRLISFFAFPVFVGIASIAPVFVEIVLGSKWAEAAYPLAILCLVMPLRMIANIYSSTLRGIGKAGLSVILTTVTGIILVIGFLVGAQWDMEGICISWLITVPLCNLIIAYSSKSYFGFGIIKLTSELLTPMMTSICMFAAVTLSYHQLSAILPPILVMLAQISIGAGIYIVLTLLLNRQSYNEIIALRTH
ncbi:MAG: lipopolysaccharide biosynthesis protein [Gammaproteobacteria bacterium]|nr:lipopolysaccharide biosynthesis protein [Gammaproteobacteria bacterium]